MKIGSLFSGAGGLDMAVEQVFGGHTVWHSEIDKAASKVLAHHWPDVPNLGDITQIDFRDVEKVDILCGGFPCQDVSAAGKRAGIKAGTRSGLWALFANAIDVVRPRLVVIENVRGLLSARAHRNLEPANPTVGDGSDGPVLRAAGAVLGDLADLGYDAQWTTFAAASVGAPHRRERVFIFAHAKGSRWGVWDTTHVGETHREVNTFTDDCFDSAHGPRNGRDEGRPEPARLVRRSDAAVSGDEPGVALLPTPQRRDGEAGASKTVGGIRPSGQPRQKDLNTVTVRELGVERGLEPIKIINGEDDGAVSIFPCDGGSEDSIVAATDGEGVAVDVCGAENSHNSCVPAELAGTKHEITLLPTPNGSDGSGGGQHPDKREGHSRQLIDYVLAPSQWGKYAPAIARWERIAGPAPAPTEPNKNGNPRLSAAFSEWMMGWPAGWVTDPGIGISRNDQLRIIGNGVCPQQATAALTWLLQIAEAAA